MESAVVTGAGRGLGRAIAARLAGRGLRVLVTDVDGRLASGAAEAIGAGAVPAVLDVRDPPACREAAARAGDLGRLAIWVNNAGVLRTEPAWEHGDDTAELLVTTNLLGVVHGSRAAVDAMRPNGGGRILNVGSLAALAPVTGFAVYSAAKHGVLAFSIALQADLEGAGIPIQVRTICPDGIATDMLRERLDDPAAGMSWSGSRLLSPDEVADRALEVLDGTRLTASVPRWRGALARALAQTPRLGLRLTPVLRRLGDRNRTRWRDEAG